jgi:uncharacterized protein YbaR (Trm112 family)
VGDWLDRAIQCEDAISDRFEAEASSMVTQEFLDMLRCPLDPGHARLDLVDDGLVCQRCRLRYPVKDGIASMLPEEAQLPPGCASLDALPCRQPASTPPGARS